MSDASTLTQSWTSESAWSWFQSSGHPFAFTLKTSPAPALWYRPQELSPAHRRPSVPGACLREAVSAAELDPTVAVAMGFKFHEEVPGRGICHAWCLSGPWHETVVDLSVQRLGQPDGGYIGAICTSQTLQILARQNGLELSDGLYERHRILAPSPH